LYAVSGVRSAIPLAANFTYFFDYRAEPKKEKSRTGAAPVHKGGQRTTSYEQLRCVQNRF